MCNVSPEHTVTVSQENDLYNVILIYFGQHCTRKLPVQGWPTANKQFFTGKQSTILSGSIWANSAQGKY